MKRILLLAVLLAASFARANPPLAWSVSPGATHYIIECKILGVWSACGDLARLPGSYAPIISAPEDGICKRHCDEWDQMSMSCVSGERRCNFTGPLTVPSGWGGLYPPCIDGPRDGPSGWGCYQRDYSATTGRVRVLACNPSACSDPTLIELPACDGPWVDLP